MMLFGWFLKNKKNKKVQVTENKTSKFQDAAAAAAFAEAGEYVTARNMVHKAAASRKILVIGREDTISKELSDYALDMAKRLNFELVALNISDAPLSLPADKREETVAFFRNNALKNSRGLKNQAEKNGVPFTHVVEIGGQDEVVDSLHANDACLRYVLTEPDPEAAKKAKGRISIPVFDLGCYQRAAA